MTAARAASAIAPPDGREKSKRPGLEQHPGDDQGLAADAVGPVTRPDLSEAPDSRIDPGHQADLTGAGAIGREIERDQTPREGIVQVVDQAGLRAGAKPGIAEGGGEKRIAQAWRAAVGAGMVAGLLEGDVCTGVPDEQDADCQGRDGDDGGCDNKDVTGARTPRRASRWRPRPALRRRSRPLRSDPTQGHGASGPTRSIFINTVIDHARPWLTPRKRLAATTHPQLGATAISTGTGNAKDQPIISSRRRPIRSASAPAARLVSDLASPKATMKERTATVEPTPNCSEPISGRVERSRPTIAPTRALTATRRVNWAAFSPSPSSTRRSFN